MRFGSLFAGIGGIDFGLERAGMTCAFQVERDPFCRRVLDRHWPDVPKYDDIREVRPDGLPAIDLLAGGFPCQPHSYAGKREASDDDRDMWPEFLRLIRGTRPRWVLAENVTGILSSEDGDYFGGILRDLAEIGFYVEWESLPAFAVGAPHIRFRTFILAHAHGDGRQGLEELHPQRRFFTEQFRDDLMRLGASELRAWSVEPRPFGVANGLPHRVDRVKAAGNSVVPQLFEAIGRVILAY